jgi:ABC-type dipeptide/oligopeptide/nickel transport system permease component
MVEDQSPKNKNQKHILDQLFRKNVWLQIYLPILLGVIALAILVAIIWTGQQGTASVWADVSLMMLIIPTFIIGLILLVILGGLTYGIAYLIGVLPDPFRRLQEIMNQVSASFERGSKIAAKPIIVPSAVGAAIRAIFKGIASIFKERPK